MSLLLQSVIAFVLGPITASLSKRMPSLLPILDGFILVSVTGLIVIEVIPHSMEDVGLWAIPLALIGLLVPTIIEKTQHNKARRAHDMATYFGVAAILFHSLIDGVALSLETATDTSPGIATAVILHRLVEGMAIWWVIRPLHGRGVASLFILFGVVVHCLGYLGSQGFLTWFESFPTGGLLALLGGALLHVLVHSTSPKIADQRKVPLLSAIGAGLAIIFLITSVTGSAHIDHQHSHDGIGQLIQNFVALARESAPALLLAYTVAGLIHALLPKTTIDWMAKGSHTQQSVRGMLFALPLPICSCGVLPLYKSLVERGVPTAAAVTLLVATPELGIDAVFLSFTMVDAPFAIARVLAAAALAMIVGLLAVTYIPPFKGASNATESEEPDRPIGERIVKGLKVGLCDLVDSTAPWIVLGLFLAAGLYPLVEDETYLSMIPDWLKVPGFALLGLPIYVCASGATPLAAILIAGGASPGAALAFLLTGPATNATTFGILSDLHGKKTAILFAVCVGLGAIGMGYTVDALLPEVSIRATAHLGHDHGEEGHSSFTQPGFLEVSLLALTLLFTLSIFRKGPRPFMTQVFGVPAGSPESSSDGSCCSSGEDEPPAPEPPAGGS